MSDFAKPVVSNIPRPRSPSAHEYQRTRLQRSPPACPACPALPSPLVRRSGVLLLIPLALLAACTGAGSQVRPARTRAISAEVLRDPQERTLLMQRMIMQIVRQTRDLPDESYYQQVRPDLDRRLRISGLHPDDVAFILDDVDRARPGRDSQSKRPAAMRALRP